MCELCWIRLLLWFFFFLISWLYRNIKILLCMCGGRRENKLKNSSRPVCICVFGFCKYELATFFSWLVGFFKWEGHNLQWGNIKVKSILARFYIMLHDARQHEHDSSVHVHKCWPVLSLVNISHGRASRVHDNRRETKSLCVCSFFLCYLYQSRQILQLYMKLDCSW